LTDDNPLLEYGRVYRTRNNFPINIVGVSSVGSWCPKCFEGGESIDLVGDVEAYLEIMNGYYVRAGSGEGRKGPFSGMGFGISGSDPSRMMDVFQKSPYLQRLQRKF
jgi:hypothetical protein